MNATPLKTILASVAQLAGVSSRQISPEQQSAMVVAVSEALRMVWDEYPWPELCATTGYYLWPDKYNPASNVTFAAGKIVRFGESFWEVRKPIGDAYADVGVETAGTVSGVQNPATGYYAFSFNATPDLQEGDIIYNPADSTETTEIIEVIDDTYIVADDMGITTSDVVERALRPGESTDYFAAAVFDTYVTMPTGISKIHEAWSDDPTTAIAQAIPYELEGDKIRVPAGYARVWLETQTAAPTLDGTDWTATESVTVGMVRYSSSGGDCFKCIANKAGNASNNPPETDTATWTRIQIPALLATAVRFYASADLLRADGKETTAIARENRGYAALESALQGVNNHQHQTRRFRVRLKT